MVIFLLLDEMHYTIKIIMMMLQSYLFANINKNNVYYDTADLHIANLNKIIDMEEIKAKV